MKMEDTKVNLGRLKKDLIDCTTERDVLKAFVRHFVVQPLMEELSQSGGPLDPASGMWTAEKMNRWIKERIE